MPDNRFAILVVNGGRDPSIRKWIQICIDAIERHTDPATYQLYVWNNNVDDTTAIDYLRSRSGLRLFHPEGLDVSLHYHAIPLQKLYEAARADGYRHILAMDSDAHPLRAGWLGDLGNALQSGAGVAGVWRDEFVPAMPPYLHASCLAVTTAFVDGNNLRFDNACWPERTGALDTLYDFTTAANAKGLPVFKWTRSNKQQFHRLMGGIYGDSVYHHGAGSRSELSFWDEPDTIYIRRWNSRVGELSAHLLAGDHDTYIEWLRGNEVPADFMRKMKPFLRLALHPRALDSKLRVECNRLGKRLMSVLQGTPP